MSNGETDNARAYISLKQMVLAGYDYPGNFLSVHALGARPVLADLDPDNWNLCLESLSAALGPGTKAVIVSHLHGGLVPMGEVMALCGERGLAVIEDAAAAESTLDPLRAQLLAELAEPGSASSLAARVGQPRQKVLVLRQLDLEATLLRTSSPCEDVENEHGAVEDLYLERLLEILLLGGAELVVKNDKRRLKL